MKNYILVLILVLLTSCSIENDTINSFYLEILPVESAELPSEFTLGEIYEIQVSYIKPSSCHIFNDFVYEIDDNERTIAVVNTVYVNENCTNTSETTTASFMFYVSSQGTYVFKFYQGQNEEGIDQYYIVEVPVVE